MHEEDGRFVIRSEHSNEFTACAYPDTDAAAARRMCDALNTGFRMGYSVGEADTQAAIRRVLGLD